MLLALFLFKEGLRAFSLAPNSRLRKVTLSSPHVFCLCLRLCLDPWSVQVTLFFIVIVAGWNKPFANFNHSVHRVYEVCFLTLILIGKMPKASVGFTKPPEPAFITKMKEQIGIKDEPTVETKVRTVANLYAIDLN